MQTNMKHKHIQIHRVTTELLKQAVFIPFYINWVKMAQLWQPWKLSVFGVLWEG